MQPNAPQDNKKLYVGNLPYSTTQEELMQMFAQYGEVTNASIITDKMSGRSKGFGFVEFSTDEAAAAAVEALHGQEMNGRNLVVNVARPFQPRERRPGGGGFGGGGFGGGGDRGGDRGGYRGGRSSGGSSRY